MTAPSNTPLSFFQILWQDGLPQGHLVLGKIRAKGGAPEAFWCDSLEQAAKIAESAENENLYFGVALQDREKAIDLAREAGKEVDNFTGRGESGSAVAIPGLWVDIDIASPVHSAKNLPRNKDQAAKLLEAVPLKPSLIVHSGHGLHAYWLFKEPWVFETDEEREAAHLLVKRLQALIRTEAEINGNTIDSTADLARLLRPAGTFNQKGKPPREVKVEVYNSGRRYNPSELEDCLPALSEPKENTVSAKSPPSKRDGPPAELRPIVDECAWMAHCYEDRVTLPESEWYRALGILGRCQDGELDGTDLAHEWSEGYPGYSREETDRKLRQALQNAGPATCDYIANQLGGHAQYCKNCTHRGKIKSPIQLGNRQTNIMSGPYQADERGLVWMKRRGDEITPVPLTNFLARITQTVVHDSGVESFRVWELETKLGDQIHRFTVDAAHFSRLNWVNEKMGPTAVVYAGAMIKDHTRVAIQTLSGEVPTKTISSHLGWRKIDNRHLYLHGGGAIGEDGLLSGYEVMPPSDLGRFILPPPPGKEEAIQAVRASLEMLDLLPDEITIPVYCAIWRAMCGSCDFSLHVSGQTGEGKSELAALAQQHWGSDLDSRHLPGSWASTENALEVLAFHAKDSLLVIDDFAPEGTSVDIHRLHQKAARLLRAQGNNAGRQRLRADATLRPTKSPRGLILSTGEDIPGHHSIRARTLILEVPASGMNWKLLTRCQGKASSGAYSKASAAFLQWLAPLMDSMEKKKKANIEAIRTLFDQTDGLHKRTPWLVAELAFGFKGFLRFAQDIQALTKAETEALWERTLVALKAAAAAQEAHTAAENPVTEFVALLQSAVSGGYAHILSFDGGPPSRAELLGWRTGGVETLKPNGTMIGWTDGHDLFLDPATTMKVLQQVAPGAISLKKTTLWKRLRDNKIIISAERKRGRNTDRKILQGVRRDALHLHIQTLLPEEPSQPSQPSQSAIDPTETATIGTLSRDASQAEINKLSQKTVPETRINQGADEFGGPVGTVGTVSQPKDIDFVEFQQ